ncbi:MAG: ABC transporter ATP-binding protein [Terrimicrobiaceae bacterium]|nr:ABC transporter ATP-binding protein [Terrimicrobiaceae bacterium]
MQIDPIENHFRGNKPWATLMSLYWPERRWVVLTVLFYLLKASPNWVLPLVTANIIDIIARPDATAGRSLWLNATVGAVLLLQNIPSSVLYGNALSRAVRNVESRLRSALVRRLQVLSIAFHSRTNTAALQTKVLRDVESVEQLSRQIVETGLLAAVSMIVALVVTAIRMPVFLPVFALIVPMIAFIRFTMTGRLQRHNTAFRKQIESMNAQILGMINMIPVTRAHAAESEEIARVESQLGSVRSAARSFDRTATLFAAMAWVMFMFFNLSCLTMGAWLSTRHILPLTPGDMILLTGYLNTVIAAVMQMNSILPIVTRGCDGLRSIGEVLECPDIEENRGKPAVENVRGEFRFESVGFRYESDQGASQALQDIDLEVAAGETIGIVGESGSGKSSLVSLVTGFHRPTAGRILLDGIDMNAIDVRTYRRHLAIVSQETILFAGTLRENILYGASGVSDAELQAAIDSANASGFIRDLTLGLDTEIGERGIQLSGGQRQRIAIARALLRDPRVLILDEATSALDAASEGIVQQALERLMAGRTTFIIAHRLSTLALADRIIVLEKGRLVECGPPSELAQRDGGRFAGLRRMQAVAAAN